MFFARLKFCLFFRHITPHRLFCITTRFARNWNRTIAKA